MIKFSNKSELDVRALSTFGLSVKTGQNSIGRFGTGLKYATAVVLRNGGDIQISSGGKIYTFEQRTEDFRGENKQFVYMNCDSESLALGFTTDLGKDWEPWQAFREFYSNCLDEQGEIAHAADGPIEPSAGTTIAIKYKAFDAIFYSLEEYFIGTGEQPLWENDDIAVYPGRSKHLFYQGICVKELKRPAAYRYNIKRYIDLTEDRTAKYEWQVQLRLTQNLPLCDNEQVCIAVTNIKSEFERDLDFVEDFDATPSTAFLGAVVKNGGDASTKAMQLVRMTMPENADQMRVVSQTAKGSTELSNAVSLAIDLGIDQSKATFVLGVGLPVPGDYMVKNKNIILAESILEDQERVTLAVIMGLAEVNSDNPKKFLAKALLRQLPDPEQRRAA